MAYNQITGTPSDDVPLSGTSADDLIQGLGGDDVIQGDDGNDLIYGGAGADIIDGGDGKDIIYGGAGADIIDGGGGKDTISGGDGNDIIDGGAGNDIIRGEGGDDTIAGGSGSDNIDGGAGTDVVQYDGSVNDYTVQWNAVGGYWTVTDPDGKTDIMKNVEGLQFDDAFLCFMAGTMIGTPDGEVPVESLKRGDLVSTTDGRVLPVSWIGRQTVSTVFADAIRVLPIRIMAGALGENVPSRDLLVSPDHAVLVDGALIQAGALVNNTSIVWQTRVPRVFTYYHVEVDDHSLILAENTPAETFIDNADRLAFDNWAEHQELYPDGKQIVELPYPRAKSHRQVPVSIRVKLADRAQVVGAAADTAAA